MSIELALVTLPKLEQINTPGTYRTYRTPEGNLYPSVTSVLSASEDKSWYDEWVARVGQEEADLISRKATKRGTRIHKYCENYIQGIPNEYYNILDKITFKSIIPIIDKITKVYAIESQLYSDVLRVAGTVDLIGVYEGNLSVIDWKTSKWSKNSDEIHSYFIQCSAYAMMFFECTGIMVKNITIIMAVDNDNPLVYNERVIDWLPKFVEMRKSFTLQN